MNIQMTEGIFPDELLENIGEEPYADTLGYAKVKVVDLIHQGRKLLAFGEETEPFFSQRDKGLSLRSQLYIAKSLASGEKAVAKRELQSVQPAAQSRLCKIQLLGCRGDATKIYNCQKGFDFCLCHAMLPFK